MIKTKDEILNAIKERFGEDTSDETLSLIEDVSDTLDDYETRTNDNTDWKTKYEENDKTWRERYRDRFFSGETDDNDIEEPDDIDDDTPDKRTFEDLFTKN